MIRYAANISMLFKEVPFLGRFAKAAEAGFSAVEFWSPWEYDAVELLRAIQEAQVRVVQFNLPEGGLGEGGFLSHPERKQHWRETLKEAIDLAARMKARQINAPAGIQLTDRTRAQQFACLEDNLSWAIPHLETSGLQLMLEALNAQENPGYLLTHSWDALELLRRVDSPWIRFQYDVYHMQRMEGNLVDTLRDHLDHIGHIQIADCPGRHQPGTGEINYAFLLDTLEELGYDGYVGLEYVPLGTTEESLAWLDFDQRKPASQVT